jgi:predicted ester cyclase
MGSVSTDTGSSRGRFSHLDMTVERLRHIPELPFAVDVIVYRPDELAERRDSPFIRRLIEEGVVLYERDNNR